MFRRLCLLATSALIGGCLLADFERDPGFVACGDEVCQPGTYCSSPALDRCSRGCVSDVNCLPRERCLKQFEGDEVGTCIREEQPKCCQD